MEVHHHGSHHHGNKSIKQHLTEFLMLFAAVTLGFFAENIREIYVENHRAEELAVSFYQDLRADELALKEFIINRNEHRKSLDSLIQDLDKNGIRQKDKQQYIWIFLDFFRWVYFEPKHANFDQIINSGSLRYFKNPKLVADISELNVRMNGLIQRQEREKNFFYNYIQPFIVKEFNLKLTDSLRKGMNTDVFKEKFLKDEMNINELNFISANPSDKSKELVNLLRFNDYLQIVTEKGYYNKYLETSNSLISSLESTFHIKHEEAIASKNFEFK